MVARVRALLFQLCEEANTHAHRVRQCPTLIYTHEPIICYFAKDITCSVPTVVVNEALVLALIVFNTIIRRRLSRPGLLRFAKSLFHAVFFFSLIPSRLSSVCLEANVLLGRRPDAEPWRSTILHLRHDLIVRARL